jgi:hypothetical protein
MSAIPEILRFPGEGGIDVAQAGAISFTGREYGTCGWSGRRRAADEDAQEERLADEALPGLRPALCLAQEMGTRLGEPALLLETMRPRVRLRREGGT